MSATPPIHPILREPGAAAEESALAAALTHLLARDDERPARWLAPAFASAVEQARLELQAGVWVRWPVLELDPAAPSMFYTAVSTLAHDPRSVAVAIRRLEAADAGRLPPWPELVQRRGRTTPAPLDTALWFG